MRRRRLLYGVGAVAGTIVGGIGIGTTTAQSSVGEFSVSDTHIETDDGELEKLWIREIHAQVSWEGFDVPADVVTASLTVTHDSETAADVSSNEIELSNAEYAGSVDLQIPSVELVSVFDDGQFEVAEGETETFEFSFSLEMAVFDTAGEAVTSVATDDATALVSYYPDDEIVDVIDQFVITRDGTTATIVNGTDEDVCVTLEWTHSGHGSETTQTFVPADGEAVEEPPGGPGGAPSYEISVAGYEWGEC